MFSSIQPKHNPRHLELLEMATCLEQGLVGDLSPPGTPQGTSRGSRGLPRGGGWNPLECVLQVKLVLAGCDHWLEMENGVNSGLEASSQ